MVIVPDASVLNHLDEGGLLESAFSFNSTIVVPDFLYKKELEEENGPYLCKLGLVVVELTPDEVSLAQTIKGQCASLSNSDCHAMVCAQRKDHTLAAGNMNLAREAKARNVDTHSLLWVLDHMDVHGEIAPTLLYQGLNKISSRRPCLLPASGVQTRLSKWEKRI